MSADFQLTILILWKAWNAINVTGFFRRYFREKWWKSFRISVLVLTKGCRFYSDSIKILQNQGPSLPGEGCRRTAPWYFHVVMKVGLLEKIRNTDYFTLQIITSRPLKPGNSHIDFFPNFPGEVLRPLPWMRSYAGFSSWTMAHLPLTRYTAWIQKHLRWLNIKYQGRRFF